MLFEEECEGCDDQTHFNLHGSKPISTLEDARRAAENFAEYIG